MRILSRTLALFLLLPSAAAFAQENPYSTWNKVAFGHVTMILERSAEKMPEENYSFRPVDSVRTYGQIIGHIADSQNFFCSLAMGEKNPALKIEETKTTKADLIAALKASSEYCHKAYAAMTDTSGAQMTKFMNMDMPKLDILVVNLMHDQEHYGNLVTYMRMKNIVPPSSEQQGAPPPKPASK